MLALALLATTLAGAGFAAGKDGPSIKVGAAFLDQMVQATLIGAHLVFDDVTLTDAQKPAVYGALQTAAQIAQKKIIAPLFAEADERRVAMEVGGSQIIKALDKKEIESCVAGFVREMPAAISREDRMALEVWARKHLRRVFAEDYVLTLLRASPYVARPGTVAKEGTDPMMDFVFSLERARANDADSPKPADGDIGGGWTYKFTIMDRASALRGAAAPRQTIKPAAEDGKLEKKRPYPRSAFDFIESLNLDAKASNHLPDVCESAGTRAAETTRSSR